MMYKHYFEALDRTMKNIMQFKNLLSNDQHFGGNTIVFGGKF